MKFLRQAVLAASLAAVAPLALAQETDDTAAPDLKAVVATVEGAPITYSEVLLLHGELPEQYRQLPIEMLYPQLVELLIDRRLMAQAARDEGLDKLPSVKSAIAFAENGILESNYITKILSEGLTDERLRAAYDAMLESFVPEEEVNASHILLGSEDEAAAVIAELDDGADFATLAKERSLDPSAQVNSGNLDWFAREKMYKEFSDAVFAMEKGKYSSAPVQSPAGWHVIVLHDRRMSGPPSYEESLNRLRAQEAEAAVRAASDRLRTGVAIERFDSSGEPLPAAME